MKLEPFRIVLIFCSRIVCILNSMLTGLNPVIQSLLGTLFTWGLTAAGAGLVFIWSGGKRKVLDASLGFAAGVMLAASYWSLLAPAIEMAAESGVYQSFEFVPVSIGFVLGAGFVYFADILLPYLGVDANNMLTVIGNIENSDCTASSTHVQDRVTGVSNSGDSSVRPRFTRHFSGESQKTEDTQKETFQMERVQGTSWRRILLLIIAITVHNIPEGLAVGVGFGAIGRSSTATFESARNLAIGIGIQNFPEGLAVSLPLRAAGMSVWKSFWYGQLSGMVEPLSGLIGTVAVVVAEPLLPYALAFAAGAMVYVVIDDIVPEANSCGNGRLASLGAIIGFVVMMSLDVGLG